MLSGLALSFRSKLVNNLSVCVRWQEEGIVQHDGAFTCFCVLNQSEKKSVTKTEVVLSASIYFKIVFK